LEISGPETVQLLNRYWHITDARGGVQEVRGSVSSASKPVLAAGLYYQYQRRCGLRPRRAS